MKTIQMNDLIESQIKNYFKLKSYAEVIEIEKGEVDSEKVYVKLKIVLDYYIHDVNYKIVDINFLETSMKGFLDLTKIDNYKTETVKTLES